MGSVLFADGAGGVLLLLVLVGVAVAVPLFNLWLAVKHPEAYREKKKHEHERRMKNRELAGKVLRPVGGVAAKVVFGALKKKFGG